jgi:hypothetical protein|tara:strand:+ start:341 stop:535 length:195 start_codon:yes stop_codon:yes gene_type:complete
MGGALVFFEVLLLRQCHTGEVAIILRNLGTSINLAHLLVTNIFGGLCPKVKMMTFQVILELLIL